MSFKHFIQLDESYKDIKNKWSKIADPKEVDKYIIMYKEMKQANFYNYKKADIGQMAHTFIGFKHILDTDYRNFKASKESKEVQTERASKSLKVFENEFVDIYVPMTFQASCKLAKGKAHWCTVGSDLGDGYWHDIVNTNGETLYYLIFKENAMKELWKLGYPELSYSAVAFGEDKINTIWDKEGQELYTTSRRKDMIKVLTHFNIPYKKFKSFTILKNGKYEVEPKVIS